MKPLAALIFVAVSANAENRPCSFSMAGDSVLTLAKMYSGENQLPNPAIPLAICLQPMGFTSTPVPVAGVRRGTIELMIGTAR
jgi:hypothetical protein